MTRIELIIRMIDGDLEAAHRVIYEDFNGKMLSTKCTDLFMQLGCIVFHNSDEFLWHTIRSFVFEYLTEDESKRLKQIREPRAFDRWLRQTATHLVTKKETKKKLFELAGLTWDPVFDEGRLKDNEASLPDAEAETEIDAEAEIDVEVETVIDVETETEIDAEVEAGILNPKTFKDPKKLSIMIEIYGINNAVEFVHKLIEDYSSASLFGSKAQPTYAKILELHIIKKMSDKDIAKEIGVSHKNMSNLKERARLNLAKFITKKVKEYEQKNK